MGKKLELQVIFGAIDKITTPFKRINSQISRNKSLLQGSRAHLKKMGVALSSVQREQQRLQSQGVRVSDALMTAEKRLQGEIQQTTSTIKAQERALDKLAKKNQNIRKINSFAQAAETKGQHLTTHSTIPMGIGLALAAKEAIAIEKSMANVAKFAPEFDGDTQKQAAFMRQLKDSAAQLSMQTGKTQTDIAAMFEEMGAAGLVADKWDSYAKKFIQGAVALDMEVGELSQTALGIAAATGHKNDDAWLQGMLEKANLSSDMGKMRASNVLEVANRGMGVAKQAGIKENDFIALTGAALDAGARDDVTGRAWKTIVARLTSTAKLTKSQAAAWESLNIDPEKFTKAFKDNPVEKMAELVDVVNKSEDGMGSLGIVIGTEFVDTVLKMGGNIETATKIQAALNDEQLRGSKFLAEYDRMQQTTAANLSRGAATARHLGNVIGGNLLPHINSMLDSVTPVVEAIAQWTKDNPKATKTIMSLALSIGLIGPMLLLVGKGLKGFLILKSLIPLWSGLFIALDFVLSGSLAASLTKTAVAFKAFGIALLTNPIFLAIAAIATGSYLIYKNWESVKSFFGGLWEKVTGLTSAAGTAIKNAIMAWTPTRWLHDVFDAGFGWVTRRLFELGQDFGILAKEIDSKAAVKTATAPVMAAAAAHKNTIVGKNTLTFAQNVAIPKLSKMFDMGKIKEQITQIKSQPFTIKQDASKSLEYKSEFNINVQTDGSVLSSHVSQLVAAEFNKHQAKADARNRAALHDREF